jgi:hypothetical protein
MDRYATRPRWMQETRSLWVHEPALLPSMVRLREHESEVARLRLAGLASNEAPARRPRLPGRLGAWLWARSRGRLAPMPTGHVLQPALPPLSGDGPR